MRKIWDLVRCDPQLTFVVVSWFAVCYVIFEDTKNVLPWWAIASACVIGGYLGFLIITKVMRPYFLWSNQKIRSWFRVR